MAVEGTKSEKKQFRKFESVIVRFWLFVRLLEVYVGARFWTL